MKVLWSPIFFSVSFGCGEMEAFQQVGVAVWMDGEVCLVSSMCRKSKAKKRMKESLPQPLWLCGVGERVLGC